MLIYSMFKETATMNERRFEKQTMHVWEWGCQQGGHGVWKRKISIRRDPLQELGSCWVRERVTDWVIQYVNNRAIEQERRYVYLTFTVFSFTALGGDRCQGLWIKLQFLSFPSETQTHLSSPPINTSMPFCVFFFDIFCSRFFISWLFSCHVTI